MFAIMYEEMKRTESCYKPSMHICEQAEGLEIVVPFSYFFRTRKGTLNYIDVCMS